MEPSPSSSVFVFSSTTRSTPPTTPRTTGRVWNRHRNHHYHTAGAHAPSAFRPPTSSPLASASSSPPKSSPVNEALTRRRMQYKQTGPIPLSFSSRSPSSSSPSLARRLSSEERGAIEGRWRAACLERARKARAGRVSTARRVSGDGSEAGDMDMDDDGDEGDDDVMQDELFRRIMLNLDRKAQHAYRLSFADEVGSSFDPDMEDPARWEAELRADAAVAVPTDSHPDIPEDELEEYACALAAAADFADVEWDEGWTPSDDEEAGGAAGGKNEDIDMQS